MSRVLDDAGLTGAVLSDDPDVAKVLQIARGAMQSETDPDVDLIVILAAIRGDAGDEDKLKDTLNRLIADVR